MFFKKLKPLTGVQLLILPQKIKIVQWYIFLERRPGLTAEK